MKDAVLPYVTDFERSELMLLIIDDLMNEVDESVANIFTRGPIVEM